MRNAIRKLLNTFFESRVTQQELIQKHVLHEELHPEIPIPLRKDIVLKLTQFIEQNCMDVEGIYRISGQSLEVRKLERTFEEDVNLKDCAVHNVAGAFKLYFREMNPPLIPYDLYDVFIHSQDFPEENVLIEKTRNAIAFLPPLNREVLELMSKHLYKISTNSAVNKMTIQNLSICIGPGVMRPLIESDPMLMMQHNDAKCSFIATCMKYLQTLFSSQVEEKLAFRGYLNCFLYGTSIDDSLKGAKEMANSIASGSGKLEKFLTEEVNQDELLNVLWKMRITLKHFV